jgi:hypothetical protein
MTNRTERICSHCGAANPLDAYFCGACATAIKPMTGTALVKQSSAPLALARNNQEATAALAIGLAAIAGRALLALARNPDMVQAALRALNGKSQPPAPAPEPAPPVAPQRTIIRRRWVVADNFGRRTWGAEEIEIQHPEG